MSDDEITREFVSEHRAFIAIAEACWREHEPSYSWHILDWLTYRLSLKYPVVMKRDQIINWDIQS